MEKMSVKIHQVHTDGKKKLRRNTTINFLLDVVKKYSESFKDIGERHFDIFKVMDSIGREQLLPMMTIITFYDCGLRQFINEPKAALFLDKVTTTYREDVQYHNDIHGSDVL